MVVCPFPAKKIKLMSLLLIVYHILNFVIILQVEE